MATAYDDDSTDEEIGMNLQLAERLNIHRGEYPQSSSDHHYENSNDYKQYFNAPKQRHLPDSSSSVDSSHKDCSFSIMHGPYVPHNKKRQNGDKTFEQFANPKRTCLNGRYPNSTDWRDSKKYEKNDIRYNGSKFFDSVHQQSEQSTSNQSLHPDKTYEDHLNNLADAEDSDLDLTSKFSHRMKDKLKEQISKAHSISCTSGGCPEPHIPYQFVTRRGVQFIESGSDEDSKTAMNGALKGGRQSPDIPLPKRRVIGRKGKKVLDSDDTEDECWKSGYRGRALVFSSSDSEDSSQKRVGLFENGTSKHHANHSFSRKNGSPHCDHYPRRQKSGIISRHRRSPTKSLHNPTSSFRSQNFAGDGCSSQFNSSVSVPTELHRKSPNKSCRSRRSTRSNRPPSAITENFVSGVNQPTSSTRGRNQAHGSTRCLGISGSSHSKALHSHRRSGSKGSRNRSLSSCRSRQENADLVAAYPELFEADEDSSEVEFFTANSYSDTETSNESLRGLTINATFVNTSEPQSNRDIICEHSVNIASSEDEISVVFSTAPHARNSEQRRNGRALGRRYGRGTVHRHFQNNYEVVSLSPDPVEQVRQMEEDERFARMLQAEFDAEANAPRHPAVIHFENWSESDDNSIIDPVGGSESEEPFESPLLPFVQRVEQIHRRGHRIPNRVTSSALLPPTPTGIYGRRRTEGRNRRFARPSINDASSYQIARMFGLNSLPSGMLAAFESSEDDYEVKKGEYFPLTSTFDYCIG
ncbi:uncharacterized protein LOC129223162 [Uloborus diversus]|uniref:uncharacterized protein LOC129223162 n=1 Tax=Uloborus diversus TaxID=327109 RepID=UPI00240A36EC|nr:uncharacterized protein LOC129223162 [Uloborus diversus]